MNVSEQTTAALIDIGGTKKAAIADMQADLDAINAELLKRIKAKEASEGGVFRAAHVQQASNSTAWKSIATKLNASRQIIAANTKKGTKDYIKYSARKSD